jgi:transcriptional regulator with XRE-family HTH domain
MNGVGTEVRRLREAKGWSQTKLAAATGMAVSGVSQIENGHRNPNSATLIKLARALGVEVADLFPKVAEPLPFSQESEQRLSQVPDALRDYIIARLEKHGQELEDPQSLHFRTATAAALWLSGVNKEARMWTDWVIEHMLVLQPPTEGAFDPKTWTYPFHIAGVLLSFGSLSDAAEERISQMRDKPDELARKRLEEATKEAAEGMRRVEELQKAANA